MSNEQKTTNKEQITTTPFPNSKKIYVPGTLYPEIKVGMREVSLSDTVDGFNSTKTPNTPVTIYDTSGPFTDPNKTVDVNLGIERIREQWILNREDVEQLNEFTSTFCNERLNDKKLDGVRFPNVIKPLRAKKEQNVSQMHYAKKGIITPEMEYIAIRENQKLEQVQQLTKQHPGENFGANIPSKITPEFVREEVARGRAVIPCNINHPECEWQASQIILLQYLFLCEYSLFLRGQFDGRYRHFVSHISVLLW